MGDFCMPSLGSDMEEGIVVEWKVKVGDSISKGDLVVEIETDKGLFEVEAFEDGVMEEILVEPSRQRIQVGTVLARISGSTKAQPKAKEPAPSEKGSLPQAEPPLPSKRREIPPSPSARGRIKASPLARKMAETMGLKLEEIPPGPQWIIRK